MALPSTTGNTSRNCRLIHQLMYHITEQVPKVKLWYCYDNVVEDWKIIDGGNATVIYMKALWQTYLHVLLYVIILF